LELIDNDRPVAVGSSDSALLQSLFPHHQLELYSSGSGRNSRASIQIAGQDYALNQPGMNAVVMDDSGAVKAQAVFSTGR